MYFEQPAAVLDCCFSLAGCALGHSCRPLAQFWEQATRLHRLSIPSGDSVALLVRAILRNTNSQSGLAQAQQFTGCRDPWPSQRVQYRRLAASVSLLCSVRTCRGPGGAIGTVVTKSRRVVGCAHQEGPGIAVGEGPILEEEEKFCDAANTKLLVMRREVSIGERAQVHKLD